MDSINGDQCFKIVDGKRKILNVIFFSGHQQSLCGNNPQSFPRIKWK